MRESPCKYALAQTHTYLLSPQPSAAAPWAQARSALTLPLLLAWSHCVYLLPLLLQLQFPVSGLRVYVCVCVRVYVCVCVRVCVRVYVCVCVCV